ncbi:hypothetical protein H5410_028073 [Solanum commersonii]|uniref:Uncharacterized protein n=1 Tax=Solanum commersonii TaxID=4109 RepID=A0A9J5Z301_SOLCO|nr:hypothetical protein H5410_028073 [Solanum commersonii]
MNENPTPVAIEPNKWCVEGEWQIYRDAKMINDKEKMAQIVTEERRVLTRSLHTIPDIYQLFNLHKCECITPDPGTYSEEMVREFYASYAATLRDGTSYGVVLSKGMLSSERLLYYGWLGTLLWMASVWSGSPHHIWDLAYKTDNQLTWDKVVMVAALVAGLEIDFSRMLLAEIHERDSGVLIWYCDRLIHPTEALDIGLIQDEANVSAPRRDPQVEKPPLGADLVVTLGQAQGSDPIIPHHSDTVPFSSSQAASIALVHPGPYHS